MLCTAVPKTEHDTKLFFFSADYGVPNRRRARAVFSISKFMFLVLDNNGTGCVQRRRAITD